MLTPVPGLAVAAGVRWMWERWTAVAFIVSGGVELCQALMLPDRSAQFQDVVSNTLGIMLGSAFAHPFVRTRSSAR
jgi:glycopeptide antibiotics resistance protein